MPSPISNPYWTLVHNSWTGGRQLQECPWGQLKGDSERSEGLRQVWESQRLMEGLGPQATWVTAGLGYRAGQSPFYNHICPLKPALPSTLSPLCCEPHKSLVTTQYSCTHSFSRSFWLQTVTIYIGNKIFPQHLSAVIHYKQKGAEQHNILCLGRGRHS